MEELRASLSGTTYTAAANNLNSTCVNVLAPLDKKIIPKPRQYSGAIRDYVSWNTGMQDFLQTQDER